jgi:hypothetical protein
MTSDKRLPRILRMFVRLGCLAVVVSFSISGCSGGGGGTILSPEDQAKAKKDIMKKFDNFDEKTGRKSSR